jgi:hypothetical protein
MCFLPPDASQVRSCILGVPGTLAPADCRPARSLSASPGSPGVKLLGLQVSPLMCSRIGPRCFGIRAHSSYPKRSARPAKKLPESPPISLFFSRFLDQAPLDSAQATRAPPSPKDMPTRSVSEDCLLHDDRGPTFGIQKTLTEFFACFFCASATLRERSRLRVPRESTRRWPCW